MIKINKLDIAIVQLHTAIDLFLNQNNYICSITLAGAAEEILGNYTGSHKEIKAHTLLINGLNKLYNENDKWINDNIINYDRNNLKHHSQKNSDTLEIDPEFSAIVSIVRAVYNYKACKQQLTIEMESFVEWLQANKANLYEGIY
jgi:hypothetical protein